MSVFLALAAALAAPAAGPLPPPSGVAAPRPSTRVGEVVVPGGPPPKLTASWPVPDGSTGAGVLAVKLVFDRPLDPKAPLALAPAAGTTALECLKTPRLLADAKTLVLLCRTAAKTRYDVSIEGPASAAGRPAAPTVLKFASTGEVIDNASDALKAAGLTDADEPIEAWTGAENDAPVMGDAQQHPPS